MTPDVYYSWLYKVEVSQIEIFSTTGKEIRMSDNMIFLQGFPNLQGFPELFIFSFRRMQQKYKEFSKFKGENVSDALFNYFIFQKNSAQIGPNGWITEVPTLL